MAVLYELLASGEDGDTAADSEAGELEGPTERGPSVAAAAGGEAPREFDGEAPIAALAETAARGE